MIITDFKILFFIIKLLWDSGTVLLIIFFFHINKMEYNLCPDGIYEAIINNDLKLLTIQISIQIV
jgi:hypothetical protein